ncbi:hypothetical protein JG687_00002887 [Phytophthora cactorum]|uniref:Uncharacterized protein n=1 Tax=Phytophthora cactorum TaxID=29920 RepID=A0A8T1UTW9_9STRA|nr:hypothetical protein JG687_00002887 [Phytophthora cactorum]
MEQLTSSNDKFLEISTSANQHLEQMHSQLPTISDAFDQAASALQSLSTDIATLHEQHASAKNDMANRFEAAMNNNAEEMVSLSEALANEKAGLVEAHARELEIADQAFREKTEVLEDKYAEMEKKYLEELEELRQSSESRILVLEGSNRVEKEEQERSAKAALKDLQTKSQAELDELRSSTQSAYTELQQRSQAEYAELQQTSTDELAAVKKTLTSEMLSLKENAAANLAALADREREHLLEKAAEEIARLQMFEIDQSSRREDRRCRETKALREELEVTKTEYCTQIKDLHRRYTSELEVLKATSKAEKKLLVQTHAEETESIRSAATRELSQTISSYEDRVHSMAVAHAAEVARNKEETAQAREDLVAKYESDLGSLQSERAREKDSLIFHYETELEALRQASRGEHDKNVKLHEAQVTQLREAHSSRILSLEMAMREQNKQTEDTLRQKDAQLESRRERIDVLEASEIALKERHEVQAERSLELVERTNMALSELESEIWRLDQLNLEKDAMLDSTNRVLKAGEEDLQTKATTILELTFVVKSRDDEIDKLRNALLDTVQTVNTKTEILELTTETLSSKAKELEATKNALRLESGKLSMVEESMSQKVGMLENSELKMESMRLNMENMRLEIKRMQMDMKLQLEHTEGEMELKNGEIRRLHGAQSELKQKNEFCQQTIERLEESLTFAQRQGEVAQRRIELLRLETKQATEDTKKVCDELLDKEQELVIMTREKQAITAEKQRLQIQFNNLSQVNKTLQEKVELHTMQAEEIQCQYQKLLKERAAENDERMRSEKHLRMLELSAAKDTIRHLEGVEGRLSDTTSRLETVTNEKRHLRAEIKTLSEILEKYEDTDRQLDAANQEIQLKDKLLQDKTHELDALNKRLCKSEDEAQHFLDMSRMETEDWMSHFYRLTCSKDEMVCRNENLESILSNLRVEKEQLMLSLSQEKREIMRRAEDLQERIAGLRKEGAQAANEISGLQHALMERERELEYLQENLGEQTTDTRKIKNTLDTLSIAHTELQAQFSSLSDQQQTETEENQKTVKSLQQHLESKAKQCESLQQSLNIQRQEIDLLMVQHDRDVMQLTDGHRSEAVQLIQSHRAQITQMTEDHLAQVSKLKEEHLSEVNLLTEERQSLTEEHHSGITRLKEVHQAEIDRLEGDLRYQVSALTVDRLSLITEQTEMHRTEVEGLMRDHAKEVETLTKSHRVEIAQKAEDYETEVTRLTAGNRSEIVRLREDHGNEVARLVEGINMNHKAESVQLEGDQPRNWLNLAADEQIRAVCAHSLELMTLHVAHQHEIELLELHATTTKQHITNQLIEQFSQLAAEHTQTLEVLESVHYQTAVNMIPQDELEVECSRLSAQQYEQTLADHSKVMDEHSASLATVRGELSEKSHALKNAEDVVTALNAKISELQAQLQATKYDAPGGTIDNVCNKKLDWGASEDLNDFSSQEAADFIQRCKNALELPGDDGTLMLDDIVEYIEQLMKILQHFELLQPKLGSPRRQPSATDPPPTLKSKVAAVLTFVEELQLITDFAQNILSDESKSEGDPGSNESSRSSLEALRVLTRTPSPAPTFDELQIDVDLAVGNAMQEFDQNLCEFSNEENASIGDMARHLQDYDYFLQQIKLDGGRMDRHDNSPASISIEKLVQEINERVMVVEQSKELLGLQNPVEELPAFLVGAREVLRQATQIRESSVCFELRSLKPDGELQEVGGATDEVPDTNNGIEAALSEMDTVVDDLRDYNSLLLWLRQLLPQPDSVKSVADLKAQVQEILTKIDALTADNSNLMQDKTTLKGALEQMEKTQDHLMKEASQESELLQQLAALEAQALLSPVEEVSTRIELVQALINQQQRACDDAQQRRADMTREAAFLRQHDLLSDEDDADSQVSLSVSARLEIYNRLLRDADRLRSEKSDMEATLHEEKNALESSLNQEIQRKSENLENVESELARTREEMDKALAEERAFLESNEVFSSILNIGITADGFFSRLGVYQHLYDKISHLLHEKQTVESCATQEFHFLQTHELLAPNVNSVSSVPTTSELSSIRLELFQRLVNLLAQVHQYEEDLTQENDFLRENNVAFNLLEPQKSRFSVYQTLLAGQNALIEEKLEREVALESEKAFLASHGVPAFDNPMEIYEEYVKDRKQLADLSAELEEELRFLAENQLYASSELSDDAANLTTPFAFSFRLKIYHKLVQSEVQARASTQQLKENMEQQLSQQISSGECKIASLTAKVERLEASLMGWQESAYASRQEWDRMILEQEDKRRSLIRYHEDLQKQTAEDHARVLEEVTEARDSALALASATNAEALEEATKEHERRLEAELHKQTQQLELAAFVHAENETRKQTSDTSDSPASPSISAAQTRAQLLEKFAKRDTTAINIVYKAIRLTTEILSAPGNTSEVSTDVTQTVLACVKELKALKEFLVQSLEQITKDDDHVPPPFTNALYAKWMADAVTRATADKECAIDLALCSHREFMSFAEIQLLSRQEEVDKALARVYDKLKTAAINGGFTPDQEKMLALELEVTREREARENVACKFRLNEEYYRKLLEERKEMEIVQAATVGNLQEECKTLSLKLEKLEHQIQQQQTLLPQFRPPTSNPYTPSPRVSLVSPQAPRVLKTATIPNVPMPMRPERPRGGGNAHKERFVSDLERETGQRHTPTARRFNGWKAREEATTENSGSELEQDFRAMQATAMEPMISTAMAAPATAPGSSLHNQELWYQGVRSIHYVSFFISIFLVPRQQLFRVEIFNSDTEQQQQTVYVTWTEMQTFLQESRKAIRLGIALPLDPEMAVTVPQNVRAEIMDFLFERVRVYGEGTENILLGFE